MTHQFLQIDVYIPVYTHTQNYIYIYTYTDILQAVRICESGNFKNIAFTRDTLEVVH